MATATVTNVLQDVEGNAIVGAKVTAQLYPGNDGYDPSSNEKTTAVSTTTNGSGAWSLTLERTDTLTPAGMVYAVVEYVPYQFPLIHYITVPAGGGTLESLLTSPPTNLPTTLGSLTVTGLLTVGAVETTANTSTQAITANGQTITIAATTRRVRLNPNAAYTGIVLGSGAWDGQPVTLINVSTTLSYFLGLTGALVPLTLAPGQRVELVWDATNGGWD